MKTGLRDSILITTRLPPMKKALLSLLLCAAAVVMTGCASLEQQRAADARRAAMMAEIQNEKPGNYFIARRYYKVDYKFWGYIRKPGQSWKEAKLVMLNENRKLAPDREGGTLGSDNGYEYKFLGYYSGDTVYEPASNGFYPEFVLTGYEVRDTNPAPIFPLNSAAFDPTKRYIVTPY